jgi:hypothetical protein
LDLGASDEWLVASKKKRRKEHLPSRPDRDRRRTRRAQRREGREKIELPLAKDDRGKEEILKWNDWSYHGYPLPPVFAEVGETKGLRADFLDVGETKELGEKSGSELKVES